MKTLIFGIMAAVLGIIGLIVWFGQFVYVIAGTLPFIFILGGALAIYIGFDELKDTWKKDDNKDFSTCCKKEEKDKELKHYKNKVEELEKKIEELSANKSEETNTDNIDG